MVMGKLFNKLAKGAAGWAQDFAAAFIVHAVTDNKDKTDKPRKADGDDKSSKATPVIEVKFGGWFNLTDSEAYDVALANLPVKKIGEVSDGISSFLNRKLTPKQRQNFRTVLGALIKQEVVTSRRKIKGKQGQPATEDVVTEHVVNCGTNILLAFYNRSDASKLQWCKAKGIMDGSLAVFREELSEVWTEIAPHVAKARAAVNRQLEATEAAARTPDHETTVGDTLLDLRRRAEAYQARSRRR